MEFRTVASINIHMNPEGEFQSYFNIYYLVDWIKWWLNYLKCVAWHSSFHFFLFFKISIHLFLAALGLQCCVQVFSSCSKQELISSCRAQTSHWGGFSCCRAWNLGTWASAVAMYGLSSYSLQALEHRFSSCVAWALLFCSMWDLPRPGIKPMCPALAGRFLTTRPPGKSLLFKNKNKNSSIHNLENCQSYGCFCSSPCVGIACYCSQISSVLENSFHLSTSQSSVPKMP